MQQPRSFSAAASTVSTVSRLRSLFEEKKTSNSANTTPEKQPFPHRREKSETPTVTPDKKQHRRSGSLGPFIRKNSSREKRISLHRRNTDDSTHKGSDRLSTGSRPRSWLGSLIDTNVKHEVTNNAPTEQKLPSTTYNPQGGANGIPSFLDRPTTPQNNNAPSEDARLGVLPSPAATTIHNRSVTDFRRDVDDDRPPLPDDAESRNIRSVVRHATPPTQHLQLIAVQGEDPGDVSPIKDSQVREIMGIDDEEDPDKTLTTNHLAAFDELKKEKEKDFGGDVSPMDTTFSEARERALERGPRVAEGEITRDVSPADAQRSEIRNSDVSPISDSQRNQDRFEELAAAQRSQYTNGGLAMNNESERELSKSSDVDRDQNRTPVPGVSGTTTRESGKEVSSSTNISQPNVVSSNYDGAQQILQTPDTTVAAFGFVHVSPQPQKPLPARPGFAGTVSGNGQFSTMGSKGFDSPVDYDHWDSMSIPEDIILTPTVEASRNPTPDLSRESKPTFQNDSSSADAKRNSDTKQRATPPILEERALLNGQEGPKVRKREIRRDAPVNGHDAVPGARVRVDQRRPQQGLLQSLSNAVVNGPQPTGARKLETEMYVVRVVASPEGRVADDDNDIPPPPPPKDTPDTEKPPRNILTDGGKAKPKASVPHISAVASRRQSSQPAPAPAPAPSTAPTLVPAPVSAPVSAPVPAPAPAPAPRSTLTAPASRRESAQSQAPQLQQVPEIAPLNIQKMTMRNSTQATSPNTQLNAAVDVKRPVSDISPRSVDSRRNSFSADDDAHMFQPQVPAVKKEASKDRSNDSRLGTTAEDWAPKQTSPPQVSITGYPTSAENDDTLVDDDEVMKAAFAHVKQEEQQRRDKEAAMVSLAQHPAFRNSQPPPPNEEALQKKESPKYEERVIVKEKETAASSDDDSSVVSEEEDELYADNDNPSAGVPLPSSEFQRKHQHQASNLTTTSTVVDENADEAVRRHAAKDSLGVSDAVYGHHRGGSDRTWRMSQELPSEGQESIHPDSRPMSWMELPRDSTGKPLERINTISRSDRINTKQEPKMLREQRGSLGELAEGQQMGPQQNTFRQITEEPREEDIPLLRKEKTSSPRPQDERQSSEAAKSPAPIEPDAVYHQGKPSPTRPRHQPIKPMDPAQEHIAYQLTGYAEAARKALEVKLMADREFAADHKKRNSPVQPDHPVDAIEAEKRSETSAPLSPDPIFADKFKFKSNILQVLKRPAPGQSDARPLDKTNSVLGGGPQNRSLAQLRAGNHVAPAGLDAGDAVRRGSGSSEQQVGKKKRLSEIFKRSESTAAGRLNLNLFKGDKSRLSTVSKYPTANGHPPSGRSSSQSNHRGPSPLDNMEEDDEARPSGVYARSVREPALNPIEETRSPASETFGQQNASSQQVLTPPLEPTYEPVAVPTEYNRSKNYLGGQISTPALNGVSTPPSPPMTMERGSLWRRDPRDPFSGPSQGPARGGRKASLDNEYAAHLVKTNTPKKPQGAAPTSPEPTKSPPHKPMFSNPFKKGARASTISNKPNDISLARADTTFTIGLPPGSEEEEERRRSIKPPKPMQILDAPPVQTSPPLRGPTMAPPPGFQYVEPSTQSPPLPGFREVPPRGPPISPPYMRSPNRPPSPPQETVVPPLPTKIPPMSMPRPVHLIDTDQFEEDAEEEENNTFLSDATPANSAHPSDNTGSNNFPSPGLPGLNGVPAVPPIPDGVHSKLDDIAQPADETHNAAPAVHTTEVQIPGSKRGSKETPKLDTFGPTITATTLQSARPTSPILDSANNPFERDLAAGAAPPVPSASKSGTPQPADIDTEDEKPTTVTGQVASAAEGLVARAANAINATAAAVTSAASAAATTTTTTTNLTDPKPKSVSPLAPRPSSSSTTTTPPTISTSTDPSSSSHKTTPPPSTSDAPLISPVSAHHTEKILVPASHFSDKEAVATSGRKSLDEKQVMDTPDGVAELAAEEEPQMFAVSYPGMEWRPEMDFGGWDGTD